MFNFVEGFARSMASPVSMPSAFIAALFQWATPVSGFNFVEGFAVLCLRRLSLRCLNGYAVLSGIICLLSR
jgi:hypothetical protein